MLDIFISYRTSHVLQYVNTHCKSVKRRFVSLNLFAHRALFFEERSLGNPFLMHKDEWV